MKMKTKLLGILAITLVFGTNVHAQTETPKSANEASQEVYEDFNGGIRFGTWALNAFVFPSVGSYAIMKDKVGGGTQLVLWGLGTLSLGIGGLIYVGNFGGSELTEQQRTDQINTSITFFSIGGLLWIANGIYNIVRSATYHRPHTQIASLIDPDAWNIALLSGRDGRLDRVQVSYTVKF
jgi:hypothetical protein